LLAPHWEAVAALQHPDKRWDLVADKQIERGGCLIESGGGTVDARLEKRLTQVERAFETLGE
jgi:flagellar biosynthesis/type III secretory pathway protein FliH